MAMSLEELFLQACKSGDIETVKLALQQNVDVNYQEGWGLRRAVRYNHPRVWQQLLAHRNIQVNLPNQFGLSALHTACRFNIPGAVFDLLKHPTILLNEKTALGSSPVMVAVKYCGKEALEQILRDKRVDMDTRDGQGRRVEEVVGVAVNSETKQEDMREVLECLARDKHWRKEEEGRRDSMEEENIDVDGLHRLKVFDKLKELVGELQELHKMEMNKLTEGQDAQSHQFVEKLERDLVSFMERQEEEQAHYFMKLKNDKLYFDQRQKEDLDRLTKKQDQETLSLQGTRSRQSEPCTSPKLAQAQSSSRLNSRRTSLKTHQEVPSCETLSESSSGPSLWDWTVPDEGYCTGKDGELPLMIDSARKELECPICMELMAPPSRIWQCKVGHVICEQCKESLKPPGGPGTSCPTCKTAPFIGRNLALERISRSLFALK